MYRLKHGRIAERWAVRDDLGMMRQLGAIKLDERMIEAAPHAPEPGTHDLGACSERLQQQAI